MVKKPKGGTPEKSNYAKKVGVERTPVTPFDEEFPEVRIAMDKAHDMLSKAFDGEISLKEARVSVREADKAMREARKKMRGMRRRRKKKD
jgi:hypothetical protein